MSDEILWLCSTCRDAHLDSSSLHYHGLSPEKIEEIEGYLADLGTITPEFDIEPETETTKTCSCCFSRYFGTRHPFIQVPA